MKKKDQKANVAQLQALTPNEKAFLPELQKILLRTSPQKPMTAPEIVSIINERRDLLLPNYNLDRAFTQNRLRKMVNFLRTKALLPIMSGRWGYFVSYELEDLVQMIRSLRLRADSIAAASEGLSYIFYEVQDQREQLSGEGTI